MEFWWQGGAIFFVGIVGGFLNTVAGGGSLLVLPALTLCGMDLVAANGTNRVAVLLQCVAGAESFRRGGMLSLRTALPLAVAATVGAAVGTGLAITIDKRVLNLAVALAISVLAVQLVARPKLWEEQRPRTCPPWAGWALFFVIGVYGGFIQAGVGFFLSWGLAVAEGFDLVQGNAVKNVIVGMYTVVSLALFWLGGFVHLGIGLVLAGGGMVGAVLGARFSMARGNRAIRWILVTVVLLSAAKLIGDALGA